MLDEQCSHGCFACNFVSDRTCTCSDWLLLTVTSHWIPVDLSEFPEQQWRTQKFQSVLAEIWCHLNEYLCPKMQVFLRFNIAIWGMMLTSRLENCAGLYPIHLEIAELIDYIWWKPSTSCLWQNEPVTISHVSFVWDRCSTRELVVSVSPL